MGGRLAVHRGFHFLHARGVLSHDGYATYNRFTEAAHQSCLAHVLRRAEGLLSDAVGIAQRFPTQVIDLFREAIDRRNEYLANRLVLRNNDGICSCSIRGLSRRTGSVLYRNKNINNVWQ